MVRGGGKGVSGGGRGGSGDFQSGLGVDGGLGTLAVVVQSSRRVAARNKGPGQASQLPVEPRPEPFRYLAFD